MEKNEERKKVMNRDIPILSNLLCTLQDVTNIEQLREWSEERKYHITQVISNAPGGNNYQSKIDGLMASISTLDEQHLSRTKRALQEINRCQAILNGIVSRTMRTFVVMLYVQHLPPEKIKKELSMTEWGFRQARKCIEEAWSMDMVRWADRYAATSEE